MKYIIGILMLVLSLSGCTQTMMEEDKGFKSIEVITDAYWLDLDSETTVTASSIIPVNSETSKLALLNGPTSAIKVFDYKSKQTVETIEIQKEGPDAIEFPIFMTAHNDSLYVYDFYANELCLLNEKGVHKRIKTLLKDDPLLGQLPNSLAPIIVTDDFIFVSTQGQILKNRSNYHEGSVVMKIKKANGEIIGVLNYPEIYRENFVAGGKISMANMAFNVHTRSLIVSFPLDNRLYEIKQNGSVLVHELSHQLNDLDQVPFSSDAEMSRASIQEIQERYVKYDHYSIIHYDPFDSIYYRVVALGIRDEEKVKESLNSDLKHRAYVIVAFNSDFDVIGVSDEIQNLDLSYGSAKYFSSPEGFFIASKPQNNEDRLSFNKIILK